jgi:hypothetical protein
MKGKQISDEAFASLKAGTKKMIEKGGRELHDRNEKIINNWESMMQTSLGGDNKFVLGVPAMLPVFDGSANHMSYQMMMFVGAEGASGKSGYVALVSLTTVRQNGELINVMYYTPLRGRESLLEQQKWVINANKEILAHK